MADRILPGAMHPMNQPTPSMQAVGMLAGLHGHYGNLKAGRTTPEKFIEFMGEFVNESKVLIKFLVENEWPSDEKEGVEGVDYDLVPCAAPCGFCGQGPHKRPKRS